MLFIDLSGFSPNDGIGSHSLNREERISDGETRFTFLSIMYDPIWNKRGVVRKCNAYGKGPEESTEFFLYLVDKSYIS